MFINFVLHFEVLLTLFQDAPQYKYQTESPTVVAIPKGERFYTA